MRSTTARSKGASPDFTPGFRPGPLGRLGLWVTNHAKLVIGVWLLLIIGLGAFAPQVEHNLSGAGWQADSSESVAARELAQKSFGGNASSRSEEHTSELQSLMRNSYAVFCLKKNTTNIP